MLIFALLDPLLPFLDDRSIASVSSSSKSIRNLLAREFHHRRDACVNYTTAVKNGSRYAELNTLHQTILDPDGSITHSIPLACRYSSLLALGDVLYNPSGPRLIIGFFAPGVPMLFPDSSSTFSTKAWTRRKFSLLFCGS